MGFGSRGHGHPTSGHDRNTLGARPGLCRVDLLMRIDLIRRSSPRCRQPGFAFLERSARRQRWFKRLIVLATAVAVGSIAWASPWGRYGLETAASGVRQGARGLLGLPRPR